MDPRFDAHNSHLESIKAFEVRDPHLRKLQGLPVVYHSPLLQNISSNIPGIYSLTGGRQVGKTTAVKLWMLHLLRSGIAPRQIAFLTGELIDDHHVLVRLVQEILSAPSATGRHVLIVDEVTYIQDWDKGIKYLADAGAFENTILLITGSDSVLIQDARKRFPGRRGKSSDVDFHLYPLTFREFLEVTKAQSDSFVQLMRLWDEYLIHGGFLPAINEYLKEKTIHPATLATYSDWIRGDVLKRGKSEQYLRELLGGVQKRIGSQVTWNSLSRELSIEHPQTISDYLQLLEGMDVLFVQYALSENKLVAAPKKARKVLFSDPFISHAVRHWLHPIPNPYEEQILPAIRDSILSSRLTESAVVNHYARKAPTFYIKGEGEVDIAYIEGKHFIPIEIKWTEQIRPSDLRQIKKYKNALVLGKLRELKAVHGVPYEALVEHMSKLV